VRYDFVHTVTHRRLLTQTNKSFGAVMRRGMIASPYEKGRRINCPDAAGRSRYYAALIYFLDPRLPVSFALKLLFFAQCTRAQYLVKRSHRLIQDMRELTPCSREDTAIMSGHVHVLDMSSSEAVSPWRTHPNSSCKAYCLDGAHPSEPVQNLDATTQSAQGRFLYALHISHIDPEAIRHCYHTCHYLLHWLFRGGKEIP
jgi:hypothetical protein